MTTCIDAKASLNFKKINKTFVTTFLTARKEKNLTAREKNFIDGFYNHFDSLY